MTYIHSQMEFKITFYDKSGSVAIRHRFEDFKGMLMIETMQALELSSFIIEGEREFSFIDRRAKKRSSRYAEKVKITPRIGIKNVEEMTFEYAICDAIINKTYKDAKPTEQKYMLCFLEKTLQDYNAVYQFQSTGKIDLHGHTDSVYGGHSKLLRKIDN